jgi:hypothetical protein
MTACTTGKKRYLTEAMAEEALFQTFDSRHGRGPVAVYLCRDCGDWHLTSQGKINAKLEERIKNGSLKRQQDAEWWERQFRR